jgi:ankyrin repeat protein
MAVSLAFRTHSRAIPIVNIFLDQGIDPDGKDDLGRTPLIGLEIYNVSAINCYHMIKWEMEQEELIPGQICGNRESLERIQQYISYSLQMLHLFVDRGSEINKWDENGITPLHWAVPMTWCNPESPTLIQHIRSHPK